MAEAEHDALDSSLVFLISLPRSGSTMLQRVLGAHSVIATSTEPWILLHPVYALRDNGHEAEYDANLAKIGTSEYLAAVSGSDDLYRTALRAFAAVMYGRALEKFGTRIFLDKTPRYHLIIAEIERLFPTSKIILLLRHPLAIYLSVLETWFNGNYDGVRSSAHFVDLMRGPANLAAAISRKRKSTLCVRYEDLVAEPERNVRRMCEFLGLEFESGMVEYGQFPAPTGTFGDTKSVHLHTRPVLDYRDAWIERFRDPERRARAVDYMNTIGPDVFATLGYDFQLTLRALEDSTLTL